MTPPFMQLWVADYLGDTKHLSTEEHGAYLLLLMAMWRAGARLPNDDTKLARIAGLTLKKWRAVKPDIIGLFDVDGDTITQNRLRTEYERAVVKSENRATAGKAGGTAKALKSKKTDVANATANATALLKHSSESDIRTIKCSVEDKSSTGADAPVVVEFPKTEKQKLDPDGNPSWWPKRDKNRNIQKNVDSTLVYDFGKSVLGKSAGGVITELLKFYEYDYRSVADILLQAHEQPNPMGWVKGNVLKRLPHERVLAHHIKYDENEYRNAL